MFKPASFPPSLYLPYLLFHLLPPTQSPDIVFQPSLDGEDTEGFYSLVESLLDDIFRFATLMPRIAKHNPEPDYHSDVEEVREMLLVQ